MAVDIRTKKSSKCEKCGHSLYGITIDRCPECGLQFDPFPARFTFKIGPGTVPGRLVILVGFALLLLFGCVILPFVFKLLGV